MITEIKGDLFDVPKDYVLAHCISACGAMGAGIAVEFTKRNPHLREYIKANQPKIGDVIYYKSKDNHAFYNLVTKELAKNKPTRKDFNATLLNFKKELLRQGIKKIAIPKIGSGLDKLNWLDTLKFIKEIFIFEDIDILIVYYPINQSAFNR